MKPNYDADQILIEHMLECIARIQNYTKDGHAIFLESELIQDAVVRNLQILAESSQRLSDAAKNLEPSVPWKNMAGMRNILVHDYLGGVDVATVWLVVKEHLSALSDALEHLKRREW